MSRYVIAGLEKVSKLLITRHPGSNLKIKAPLDSPKRELEKALEKSARQALRLAQAYGKTVPVSNRASIRHTQTS